MEFYFKSRQAKIVVTVFDDELPAEFELNRNTQAILDNLIRPLFDWVLNTLSQLVILASDPQLNSLAPILAQRSVEGLEDAIIAAMHYKDEVKGGNVSAEEVGQAESQLATAEESGQDFDPYAEFLDTLLDDEEDDD